jgi:hypothetical protein
MKMKAKLLIAAALLAATGASFAQEYVDPAAGFVSTKTRAEVIAEVEAARADGTLAITDDVYPVVAVKAESKTREQVRAELDEYKKANPRGYLYSYYIGQASGS